MENTALAIPKKEVLVCAKKENGVPVPGSGEKIIIYRLPLQRACLVFDLVVKHMGESLVTIGAKVYASRNTESKDKKKQISFSVGEIKDAISTYADNLEPGATFQLLDQVILPYYVKASGKSINLEEFYKRRGFIGLMEVFSEVLKYNFSDFLSSG